MILVGQFDSPFVRRVAVTLNHYHLVFDRAPLSVFGDKDKVQELNPLLRVPVLILDSGERLIDSNAIIDHLDHLVGPHKALTPDHGPERRKVLQACAVSTGISDKVVALFFERNFHDDGKPSAKLESRYSSQISQSLAHLENLSGAPWFFDNHISQADVTITCMLAHIALRLPEFFPDDHYPKLHALVQNCEAHPAFEDARINPNEGVPKKL